MSCIGGGGCAQGRCGPCGAPCGGFATRMSVGDGFPKGRALSGGGWAPSRVLLNNSASPGGGGGSDNPPPPPLGPPPPLLSDWKQFFSGSSANQKFSLVPSAQVSLGQKISSPPLAPLTTQGLLRRGGVPPTAPPTHPPWTPPTPHLSKTLGPP